MTPANIAIIGSNGFIGRHLTAQLLQNQSCRLHLFGRSPSSSIRHNSELNYKQINLLDAARNREDFRDIDVVYYLASETIPASSWDKPLLDVEKNLVPFLSFAECIAPLKVKKIVFLSSAGTVYGTTHTKVNENAGKNPFSPYGIVKLAIENFLLYYKTRYNINYDIYRISNVFGPGQDTSKGLGLINTLLEKIILEGRIRIFGDGSNLRNYIYVKDAAKLLSLSMEKDTGTSEIYNLSSDTTLTINQIIELIRQVVPHTFEVIYEDQRKSDNTAIDLDNNKLKNTYPDFHFTPVSRGIEETYHHLTGALKKK